MAKRIYKIVSKAQWEEAKETGVFVGAEIDLTDGYIHFSSAHQTKETVARHFDGRRDLLLVAVDPAKLGDDLQWEPSRGGELFPHLYAELNLDDVESIMELSIGENGAHVFPEL